MEQLKVCFIGIGSIAKRHIHNLRQICEERNVELTIDAYRREYQRVDDVDKVYVNFEDVPSDYDAIFITNPTEKHLETLKKFHNKGKHFFIEKPLVSLHEISNAKAFHTRPDSVYYVACPLRYSAVIQWIKNNINSDDVISVRSISSSYLPEWRPGQDYRETYSAHKSMGGGVSIDLIHEWDYLTFLFGWPEKVLCMIGKKSNLEIDSDDYAVYIAEYDTKIVELHLDYFGKGTIREIQLFTKYDTVIGDIAENEISFVRNNQKISFNENRNDYQKKELEYFLELLLEREASNLNYYNALRVLELTQGIITWFRDRGEKWFIVKSILKNL